MKNLLFIALLFLLGFTSIAQTKKYYSNLKDTSNVHDYIILKRDTLFNTNQEELKPIVFDHIDDANNYYNIAFNHTKKSYLKQWKSEIKIFISKKLSKRIQNEFIDFVSTFPKLKNLKLSFVNKIEDANYFIKATNNFKSVYDEKKYTEEVLKKNIYYNIRYNIQSEGNGYKSCVLKFDPKRIFDEKVFTRRLKVTFFVTMGNFRLKTWLKPLSLLKKRNDSIHHLSNFDKKLLRYHYQNLYDIKIDSKLFAEKFNRYEK